MTVRRSDVERIAALAHLTLDEDQTVRLTEEMNRILAHADRLHEVGGAEGAERGEAPLQPDSEMSGVRSGTVVPDELLARPSDFAPRYEEGFFVVPPPPGVSESGDSRGEGAS